MGDLTRDTMAAIELVTQLQKVRDLDPRDRLYGDTDGSSIYSLSTVDQSQAGTTTEADSEIIKPKTRRPKRSGHLSLDRVFRKRFHKLKKELEVCTELCFHCCMQYLLYTQRKEREIIDIDCRLTLLLMLSRRMKAARLTSLKWVTRCTEQ